MCFLYRNCAFRVRVNIESDGDGYETSVRDEEKMYEIGYACNCDTS